MQPCGRLIQNIDGFAGGASGQLFRQFDTLCLTAGQGRGLLANAHIAQPHTKHRLQLVPDKRHSLEILHTFFNCHIKDIRYRFVSPCYFQSFAIISFALAGITGDIDIRQKMHLNLDDAVSLTSFTTPAFHIEAEPAGGIAAAFGFRQAGKPFPDRGKGPCISRRIGTRGPANR